MSTFLELAKKRYSCRSYTSDPIDDTQLQQILEAARLAPTAANRQPFALVLTHTAGQEAELRRIYDRDWFVQAPLIITVVGLPDKAWVRKQDEQNYVAVDATIALDHLILAAADLGLGTCWIAAFDPVAAREVLALPDDVAPLAMTPLGHPADAWRPKKRVDMESLIHHERW